MRLLTGLLVLVLVLGGSATVLRAEEGAAAEERPLIEVVFCLDSTGSMGGEIAAAKEKIWDIANKIMEGKPRPRVRMGVVTYRDRGDDYVTKKVALTEDIDKVHEFLMKIEAGGGGDGPEDVRTALKVSTEEAGWSTEKGAIKLVFLVGDAPPHDDYTDVPSCLRTAEAAVAKGININTVACGSMNLDGVAVWKKVAELSDGSFQQLPRTAAAFASKRLMAVPMASRRMMMDESADCAPAACASCPSPCGAAPGGGMGSAMDSDDELGGVAEEAGAPAPAAAAKDSAAFEKAILDTVKRKAESRGITY